jgi:opacity protein-like surface antigen
MLGARLLWQWSTDMQRSLWFALALLVALPLSSAHAQSRSSRDQGWEFGFELIYQLSSDLDFDGGSSVSTDDDLGFSVNFGYRFNARLAAEFGFDWMSTDYDASLVSTIAPSQRLNVRGEYEMFAPRASLTFNLLEGDITPYVSGGIGWAFIDTNIPDGQVVIGCWWDPWWGQICAPYQSTRTVDEFTYHVGAGLRWDLPRGYALRLGYEREWVDFGNASGAEAWDQIRLNVLFRY